LLHGAQAAPMLVFEAGIRLDVDMVAKLNPIEGVETRPSPKLPDCGQRVSVEHPATGQKLWTTMLGYKPGSYILLEKPPGTDAVEGKHVLKDGDSLIIRFFKDGTIYGFRTPILCTITMPYRLLFAGFPTATNIVEYSLRSSPRLACYLPCSGEVGGRAFSRALIRDFSATGCQLRIPLDALEPEPESTDPADAAVAEASPLLADENAPTEARTPEGDDAGASSDAELPAEAEDADADADSSENEHRLTLELQLPGEDEVRFVHGDVLEWQTLERFHLLRVHFDEPQDEIFEQLTVYTTRIG